MQENEKKYYKKIDIIALENKKNHINKIDMQSMKPTKYILRGLIFAIFTKAGYELTKILLNKRKEYYESRREFYLNYGNSNELKRMKNVKIEYVSDFLNKKDYFKIESDQGIYDLREKIIENSDGHVLEVNCGVFINKSIYEEKIKAGKIKSISAIDSNENCLEIASANCNNDQIRFYSTPENKIPFPDNSFDTVIDTYGMSINPNFKDQFNEMIRVCKPGGKIKLLEFGESSWSNMNYVKMNLMEQGKLKYLCYVNWIYFINNYKNIITNLSYRRRLNGICYLVEFNKI